MDPAALRSEFPVLQRVAYLNAGTDGPLPAAAVRFAQAELESELTEGRALSHFERRFELQAGLRAGYARVMNCAVEDVALTTSYGPARLAQMTVWADACTGDTPGGPPEDADELEAAERGGPAGEQGQAHQPSVDAAARRFEPSGNR